MQILNVGNATRQAFYTQHLGCWIRIRIRNIYLRYNHSIAITSIAIINYIQVKYMLYHRMLKYHTTIYQLENMKSLLFNTFVIQESKNMSESIMPTTRS